MEGPLFISPGGSGGMLYILCAVYSARVIISQLLLCIFAYSVAIPSDCLSFPCTASNYSGSTDASVLKNPRVPVWIFLQKD